MKKTLSILLTLALLISTFAIAVTFNASAEDGWELVWNDEFSGNTLDTTKWENLNTKKSAPRPNESEVQEDNAYVEDGKLIIKNEIGKCEPGSSAKYTTARLMTMDMFKYGKFEIRAKCAEATGTNSAFWTWGFPNDPNYKFHYWPKGQFEWTYGEIDLVERFNAVEWNNANYRTIKSQLHFIGPYKDKSGTVHTNKSEWSKTTYDSVKPGDVKSELSIGQDYGTSWHTFGCEWNADEIKLFRDGIQYGTLDLRYTSDTYPTAADAMDVFREYCQKFIISDWMGSYGPVSGDSTFQIDYFRVWQKPGCLINYNEYGTSAYNAAKKVQTMDTNLATSEEVYYQPELKGNASYTIFDADASSVNYPTAPQGAIANSIASKEKRNALRIKRTSQYDNVCIQFPGDYSSVAQKAKYLRMWVACDEGAMYYADQKGGVSYGFRTTDGKYYFANGEKGLNYCSSNVSYFGNYHWVDLSNLKLTETDVNKYDSYGDRLKDVKGGQTTSFSSIAGKIDAVYVNFGVISGMGNATGVNDCYYIDDLEFVNDATVPPTSATTQPTAATTTKSSDTATNVSVYNNSKIKLLGRAFQVGSKYSSGMASANSSVCLPWVGDGIEYSYTSSNTSSLTAKVAVGGSTYGKTSFTLLVDGVENGYYYINSTATDTQFQEYTLTFNNLPSGTHTARLVRRDKDFAAAHTYLKSLSFNGTLNNAPATSNLKIEFIGDSITVGDGLSEVGGNDITKAWAYLTAKGVNAEYSIVAKGGYNIQKILDQNLYKSWSTVANNIDYSPTKKADMVIINLGTNKESNEDTFYSNAVKLINIVRNIHGSNVKVLWVYNMMTAQYLSKMQLLKTNGYVNGVVELKRDTAGSNGHPTAQGQLESANILINYLKTNYNYNGTTQTESSTTAGTTATPTATPTAAPTTATTAPQPTQSTTSSSGVTKDVILDWSNYNGYSAGGFGFTKDDPTGYVHVSGSKTLNSATIIAELLNWWGWTAAGYDKIQFTAYTASGSCDIRMYFDGQETAITTITSTPTVVTYDVPATTKTGDIKFQLAADSRGATVNVDLYIGDVYGIKGSSTTVTTATTAKPTATPTAATTATPTAAPTAATTALQPTQSTTSSSGSTKSVILDWSNYNGYSAGGFGFTKDDPTGYVHVSGSKTLNSATSIAELLNWWGWTAAGYDKIQFTAYTASGSCDVRMYFDGQETATTTITSTPTVVTYDVPATTKTGDIKFQLDGGSKGATVNVDLYIGDVYGIKTSSEHVHTPDASKTKVVNATCVEDGYTECVCAECGETYTTDIVKATGVHTYTEKVDAKYLKSEANCVSKAVYYKTCSVCGHVGTETFEYGEINANNHSLEHVAANPTTHALAGNTEHWKCANCSKLFSDANGANETTLAAVTIAKLPYVFGDYQFNETKHWRVCTTDVCGEVSDEGEHTYGEWVVVTEATETKTGLKERTCTVCGYKQSELIPIVPIVTEPTTAEPTTAEPTTAEPTTAEPTTAEPTTAEPTTAEQTTVAPTATEPGADTYGDANGDGKINLLDLVSMRKYLAKWNIELNTDALDCNADGNINLLDLILLRKYLAKWNVVLGPQA